MIQEHQTIELYGLPVFSLVTLITPHPVDIPLPAEACVAFVSKGDGHNLFLQNTITANPGSIIVSTCGRTVGHMVAKQEAGKISTIIAHFHHEQLENIYKNSKPKLWKELEKPVAKFVVQEAASNLILKYFESIGSFFSNKDAITDEILALKIQELILLLLQSESSMEIRLIVNSLFSNKEFTFKELVDTYIFMPFSIEGLASLTNMSVSTFKREFTKVYKTTPGAYILDKRLEKVAEELIMSDDLIMNIGYDCGFVSNAHLSRSFKSKYGLTPSKFRSKFS